MATFVRIVAQKLTAEICPMQPFVMHLFYTKCFYSILTHLVSSVHIF
jgi:hypothetical protein